MNIVKLVISFCDHCVLLCNNVQNVWDSFPSASWSSPWMHSPRRGLASVSRGVHWFRQSGSHHTCEHLISSLGAWKLEITLKNGFLPIRWFIVLDDMEPSWLKRLIKPRLLTPLSTWPYSMKWTGYNHSVERWCLKSQFSRNQFVSYTLFLWPGHLFWKMLVF